MINVLKKETAIYGVGRVLGSSISFFLFPFYTHALHSTGEYGVVQLIIAFIAFTNIIFLFGFDGALMKYYVSSDSHLEKQKYLTNTYAWVLFFSSILLFLLILFKSDLSLYVIAGYDSSLIVKIALILFFDALRAIHLLILRAENRALNFTALLVLDIILLTTLNIYFVGFQGQGIEGIVQANLISSVSVFVITLPIILKRFRLDLLSFSNWKTLKEFAFPLMPAGLFWMILEFADRKMLEFLIPNNSLHTVGIYGAGYKLGALMLLLVYAFNYAWRPYFLKENNIQSFRKISSYVFFGLGFFYVVLVLYVDTIATSTLPIINTSLIDYKFWEGFIIVPIIALAYIFHGSFILQEAGPFLSNQVYKISICRGVGVTLNIILNLILIPYCEKPYLGAAIATLISYFSMSFILYVWNYKESKFRYDNIMLIVVAINICVAWYCSTYDTIGFKILLPILYLLQFKYYTKCKLMK